ncbi:MAG: glycerol kinase GlpK, partial [Acidobacteriota bacterium]
MPCILTVDQSTSATKALILDTGGQILDQETVAHQQYYPRPGWVEHDAEEIYANTLAVCRSLLERGDGRTKDLLCLSITNQRETIVVFDRKSGKPLYPAIVWQCRRAAPFCAELVRANHSDEVHRTTGLKIDTYFPAPKLAWLFKERPEIRSKVQDGSALIGTIDTYLIYRLTRCKVHATDHTNACRTLLYDISKLQWSEDLCRLFEVPRAGLPEILESSARFGETDLEGLLDRQLPICGVMGDSQGALFAQRCFDFGDGKVTLGTGSSVLVNLGSQLRFSDHGIVSTIGWVYQGKPAYSFEGIINFTGAVIAWLKDQLQLISEVRETETLASEVQDTGGVYLVPAFVGLSAPYWAPEAKGAILGLTPGSDKRHIVRAALESVAFQIRDLLDLIGQEIGMPLHFVRVDGGMVSNKF